MAFVKDHPLFKLENQIDFIEKEELPAVVQKCTEGDDKAIERMILSNLRLVSKIVSKYAFNSQDYEDMISVGIQGLTNGVKKLRPDQIPTLRNYLSKAITHRIIDYLNKEQKTVRDKSRKHDLKIYSLNVPVGYDDENSEEQIDLIRGREKNGFESFALSNDIDNLKVLMQSLDKREQGILKMYYGIGQERKTLEVIGEHYNISKVRVSQINKEAILKMRRKMCEDELRNRINSNASQEFYFNGKID